MFHDLSKGNKDSDDKSSSNVRSPYENKRTQKISEPLREGILQIIKENKEPILVCETCKEDMLFLKGKKPEFYCKKCHISAPLYSNKQGMFKFTPRQTWHR